jgi:hypothetical protein
MTITVTDELDVVCKYKELLSSSLDVDSIYIKTKETIQDMFDKGYIKDDNIAEIVTQVLAQANASLVTSAMSTALGWANAEKEVALKKLELAKQLDILDGQIALTNAQANKTANEDIATQANTIRQNGMPTVVDGKVVSLTDTGAVYENILLTREKAQSEDKAQELSDAKVKETHASINKLVADTYVNYGMFSGYTIGESGLIGVQDNTPAGYTTLSSIQGAIAKEQAKGYAYNAWANAASGLGSTIGVALTSETDIFTGEDDPIITSWKTTIDNLRDVQVPTF